MVDVGDRLPTVELETAQGEAVEVGAFLERTLLVVAVRYYGCIPCQRFLVQVREAYPRIRDLDADAISVGVASGWQAQELMEGAHGRRPVPFPCLVDPERNLYRALGLGRVPWWHWFTPTLWRHYWRAFRSGARQGKVTGGVDQLAGVAVVEPDRRIRWLHRARTIGDYPPIETVLEALRRG
jgi:peroxiredoxin